MVFPDDISERMDAIEALREESCRANAEAAKESRSLVAAMREEGFTLDDIGRMLGLTKGRVSQLTKGV
ncbi:sigma factor-like helix-turn-helix DNA-binding protein [Actinomycetaceae bacterium MB13-C1-2]|nr:sigma factor-like helix-turn-helix DNA-binding protein [Actinomycetaceae bacterium MB13-C1-2]